MTGPDPASQVNLTYQRLLTIARAWATVGTEQYGDPAVAELLAAWYRYMTANWYNPSIPRTGNWWFWEIGNPRVLGDLSVLVDSLLTQADREAAVAAIRHFAPNPNVRTQNTALSETGGNRADKALACFLRGITARSDADMALARDALSDVQGGGKASLFRYVTSGNGFYADGSYIDHDWLPYVGTYGNVALIGIARSLMLVARTPWDVVDPNVAVILDAPEKAFAPFIWNGRMMETVRGRAVSRAKERDYHDAWTTTNAIMLLGTQVAEPYRSTYRTLAKTWLTTTGGDYQASSGLSDLSRALPLLADDSVAAVREPVGHIRFGSQGRMVHRGHGWAYTVSTSSKRIGRFEWGNNENSLGWHQGDGVAYLYLESDKGQFADDFWPTVDPYRLPGTTASLAPRPSGLANGTGIPRAANSWGGGVALAGAWGTAGMDLTSSPIKDSAAKVSAKKSWFLLDDMVIALGSGVDVTGAPAETVVENRSFRAGTTTRLSVDGERVRKVTEGLAPSWAYLPGVAGYVFLGGQTVRAAVEDRTGSWYDINSGADTQGPKDPVTRTYATLSVQHAAGSTGGTYGYVVLPGATEEATRAASTRGLGIEVLRQDDVAHVVRVQRDGRWFVFAHLFAATTEGAVRADGPVAVVVSGTGSSAQLAVSSPTRSLERATVELDLGRPFRTVTKADPRLTVTGGDVIRIDAGLGASAGASFEASLSV